MPHKNHHLSPDQLRPIAVGYGAAYATDRITVDGAKVGYCYREEPDSELDSGWRFFAGDESQEYADNPDNIALYDINTIANCDPSITAILESPAGSAYERDDTGQLVAVYDSEA
ncbi:MAG: DUF2185 domain-containing protein [Luteimonas sp.]|nr:DUF2185 domain-containing protein [Luteimonas sp.]